MASVAGIGIQIEYCRRTYPGVYLIRMLGILASVAVIGIQIGYYVSISALQEESKRLLLARILGLSEN